MWYREEFRKEYKEKHPDNKSVAAVSILFVAFFYCALMLFCFVFIYWCLANCLEKIGWQSWWR